MILARCQICNGLSSAKRFSFFLILVLIISVHELFTGGVFIFKFKSLIRLEDENQVLVRVFRLFATL